MRGKILFEACPSAPSSRCSTMVEIYPFSFSSLVLKERQGADQPIRPAALKTLFDALADPGQPSGRNGRTVVLARENGEKT